MKAILMIVSMIIVCLVAMIMVFGTPPPPKQTYKEATAECAERAATTRITAAAQMKFALKCMQDKGF